MKLESAFNMSLFKKKKKRIKYRFADDIMAKDAIISLVLGVLSAIAIVVSVIMSIIKKGQAGEDAGIILLAALIMSITGLVFGLLALKSVEGGTNSKYTAVTISLVDMGLVLLFYVFSQI